jgi:membrane-associated phospholipid phosphatase
MQPQRRKGFNHSALQDLSTHFADRYLQFMAYTKWILFPIIFLTGTFLNAQETRDTVNRYTDTAGMADTLPVAETVPPLYRINKTYLKTYWSDFKGVVSAPARWKGRDWVTLGLVAGSAGLMMAKFDPPVKEFILRNPGRALDKTAQLVYPLGNTVPPLILAGIYATGVITRNRELEHSSLVMVKSLALSTILYTSTKAVIRRQRPVRTDDPRLFTTPFTKNDYTSFPSGHSNTAFSVATAFALEYRHKKWVPWVAYPLATVTALARMYQNRHWTSDVIIGSAIGHFVTKTVYNLEERRAAPKKVYYKP